MDILDAQDHIEWYDAFACVDLARPSKRQNAWRVGRDYGTPGRKRLIISGRARRFQKNERFWDSIVLMLMESCMVRESSRELREKAEKYRALARWVGDRETNQRILAFTTELEQQASIMEKPTEEQIRKRAQELWEQAGKPEGRDEEIWHQAERELQDSSHRTPDNL